MKMPRSAAGTGNFLLALAAVAGASGAARAQDTPPVISPLRVETDHEGVNLRTGKTVIDPPMLSVPAAPNLRFDRIQNAAPYVFGRRQGQAGEIPTGSFSVHLGERASESFECYDVQDCGSVTQTGSTFRPPLTQYGNATFRQAGTGALWRFNVVHVNTAQEFQAYASSVAYPNGEVIGYAYETAFLPNDPFHRTFYRPIRISSNLGYFIAITYNPGGLETFEWAGPRDATLYAEADPATPLARLTYTGTTVTDLGGRVYGCTGCSNALGVKIEVAAGSTQLPGESAPARAVTALPGAALVGSVANDGVQWNYSYTYHGGAPQYNIPSQSYRFDRIQVTGPNGFSQVYQYGASTPSLNITDPLGRTTSFLLDQAQRPTRATYPEGNSVDIVYDDYANIVSRTATPKPGSGQSPITETALYPDAPNHMPNTCPVMCWRATWRRDALGRQTDYLYNDKGQLTEQTEPADAAGVRRRTIVEYALSPAGVSRRSAVRICGVPSAGSGQSGTCGTSAEIRTEYQYWGNTQLPSLVRQIDAAGGAPIETAYAYDPAGRLLSTDGPLPGSGDASYARYDVHGRKTWEIGALGANGLRVATRFTYRDSDDKPLSIETGTVPDASSTMLTVLNRTDISYDGRRNPIREALSAAGTTYGVTDSAYDDRGRVECQARRMNPAAFAAAPGACALGAQGAQGPDRITHNSYDAAGQLLQVQGAYGVTVANGFPETLQQNEATYTYSPNGLRQTVTDGNGNASYFHYEGHDRLQYWVMPSATATGYWNWANIEYYGYDAAGNRTLLVKRDGSTLNYVYDALNRLIVKVVPERAGLDPTNTRDVHYAYDLRNQQTEARFDSLAGDGVSNVYDGFGRLASSTTRSGALARTLSYDYDPGGRRTRITHPDGQAFTYAYSPAGELTGIYQGIGTSVPLATFAYNAQARLGSRSEGAGGSGAGYTYDAAGRLAGLTDTFAGGTGNVALTLGYNPASQIVSQTRTNDAYAWTGAYSVNRTYTVNGLNQYAAAGPTTFAYDANGNLTSETAAGVTRAYTYDVENRLVAASGGVQLGYDPLGRLAWTTGSPNFTRFLYDGDALVAEYDYSGILARRYVHGSNAGADDPLVWYEGAGLNAPQWLHADHQGSIVAIANGSGAMSSINAYDEYGIPGAANNGRFQYTGQIWLGELGMYHYKARIYSPTLGRFLQTDPIGYDDQLNLYAYVGNDPVNASDPTGESIDTQRNETCGSRLGVSASCSGQTLIGRSIYGALRSQAQSTRYWRQEVDRSNETWGEAIYRFLFGDGRVVNASLVGITPAGRVAGPLTTIQRAGQLADRAGRNSVFLRSPSVRMRVDLRGRPHGRVPTPHVQRYRQHINPRDPSRRSWVPDGRAAPATSEILRMVDHYLRLVGL